MCLYYKEMTSSYRSVWNQIVLCALLVSLVIVAADNKENDEETAEFAELALCFERGYCGAASLGSFKLSNSTNEHKKSFYSRGPSDITKNVGKNNGGLLVQGHIYEFYNYLSRDVTYYWNVVEDLAEKNVYHSIVVPSRDTRYVDTQIFTTHTIKIYIDRLQSNSNNLDLVLMDTIIGLEGRKCAGGKKSSVCDYLFRACFKTEQSNAKEDDKNTTRCLLYEDACAEQNSQITEKQTCVKTCMKTYYSHLLSFQERVLGVDFNVHPESVLKCIVEYEHKASRLSTVGNHFKQDATNKFDSERSTKGLSSSSWVSMINEESNNLLSYESLTALHDTDTHTIASLNSAITTITILLIITLMALLFSCFFYCRNSNYRMPSFKLVHQDQEVDQYNASQKGNTNNKVIV